MKKRCLRSLILIVAWMIITSPFYKMVIIIVLYFMWRRVILSRLHGQLRFIAPKAIAVSLGIALWFSLPLYTLDTGRQVRIIYLDDTYNVRHAPLRPYLTQTLLPKP